MNDATLKLDESASRTTDSTGIERYIESYRHYLTLLANDRISPRMRAKVGASDLVQETLLAAHRDRARFRGETEAELRQWLVRMLTCNVLDAEKAFRRRCRDVGRETQMTEERGPGTLVDTELTPGRKAIRAEEQSELIAAIERLPEHYATVVWLRGIEQHSFDEIAKQTGKSVEAVRHVWFRAVKRLGRELAVG